MSQEVSKQELKEKFFFLSGQAIAPPPFFAILLSTAKTLIIEALHCTARGYLKDLLKGLFHRFYTGVHGTVSSPDILFNLSVFHFLSPVVVTIY